MTFRAERKNLTVENRILKVERGQIEPGGGQSWENVEVVVPPCPPSQLRFCSLIDVEYYFEVSSPRFI